MGSFNKLDGQKVACDLENNQQLWTSFVFGRYEYQPLIELRDLPRGLIKADTLFVLAERKSLKNLLELVTNWRADEVGWRTGSAQGGDFVCKSDFDMLGAFLGDDDALVRVWWD